MLSVMVVFHFSTDRLLVLPAFYYFHFRIKNPPLVIPYWMHGIIKARVATNSNPAWYAGSLKRAEENDKPSTCDSREAFSFYIQFKFPVKYL